MEIYWHIKGITSGKDFGFWLGQDQEEAVATMCEYEGIPEDAELDIEIKPYLREALTFEQAEQAHDREDELKNR